MKNFKRWFYENIDDMYKHPSKKNKVQDLDTSHGMAMRVNPPIVDNMPENMTLVTDPHITLIKSTFLIPIKKKVENIISHNQEFHDLPKPIYGKQIIATRSNGKVCVVANIENQSDFQNYVDKLWLKLGVKNPEKRHFHVTLANNNDGDPYESIGDIHQKDFNS